MGVLYLADALCKTGHECEIVENTISCDRLKDAIMLWRPDVIGMSVLTTPQVADFERLSLF